MLAALGDSLKLAMATVLWFENCFLHDLHEGEQLLGFCCITARKTSPTSLGVLRLTRHH